MKFQPKSERGFVKVKCVKGTLSRFDGKSLSVGYGDSKPLTRRKFIIFSRRIIATAKLNKLKSISVSFKELRSLSPKNINDEGVGKISGEAFEMANYEHSAYRTKKAGDYENVETVAITDTPDAVKEGFWMGHRIGTAVNACRELSNTPGGDMTPRILAEAAKKSVKGTKARVKVLGRADMKKLGMGAVLGIAKGSVEEPQFIIMEYWGAAKSQKPVVLVGKGVTFDTGGLNLKPGDHMYEMHMDMSGGAAVIHSIALAAKLGAKTNIIGLIPAVENNPGNGAVRPGDILQSLSGKTIEVLNTDAEGRVILADAITYAKRYNPRLVVDVATLTGPSVFGQQASSVMTNTDTLIPIVNDLAERSGDYVWALPLWDEFDYIVKGQFADVPNIPPTGNSRWAYVIAGGKFLEVFAKDLGCPWLHIDMGSRMTPTAEEFLSKGAAGAPVRLLLALIQYGIQ